MIYKEFLTMRKPNESKQMYLKTILKLGKDGSKVRNIDIAAALGYSKPSVTNAVKKLVADGFVEVSPDNEILLTESGFSIASNLEEKCSKLETFLRELGADPSTAEENACRMEHVLSDELCELICEGKGKL